MIKLRKKPLVLAVSAVLVSAAAYAAVQITVTPPIALNDVQYGDRANMLRADDGTLIAFHMHETPGAGMVYDVQNAEERPARDFYVMTCKPDSVKTCNVQSDWTPEVNVSKSALKTSINADWKGNLDTAGALPYPGDSNKNNIKMSGSVVAMSWISKYCPDGDTSTSVIDPVAQRAVLYPERNLRVIPFSCVWSAASKDNGLTWSAPVQMTNGKRDAMQDCSAGMAVSMNADPTSPDFNKKGSVIFTWQEDPQGLLLSEGDGPGDGAAGSNVNHGTDIWYTNANVDLNSADITTAFAVNRNVTRVTDNSTHFGVPGAVDPIYDHTGAAVDSGLVERGQAGASRPNTAISDSQTILIYEETKNSAGLDEGKFVRYNTFAINTPPTLDKGCIISNPVKGGKRARILTQSAADAGADGVNVAVFWREGFYNKGGPADIVVRRGMGGLTPDKMVPAVDTAHCVTSDYAEAIALTSTPAENISSSTPTATSINLGDDTESLAHPTENALAHHGFLRGDTLIVGYTYTSDIVKLWAQLDNYNFWLRKYTVAGGWVSPFNASNVTNMNVNVREPRVLSTPKSSAACATDPTQCQNKDIYYVAWGTQENVQPFDPEGGDSLGVYITASLDSLNTLAPAVQLSSVAGPLSGDTESAIECEVMTRPDGKQFWSIWNQENAAILTPTGSPKSVAEFTGGTLTDVIIVTPTSVDYFSTLYLAAFLRAPELGGLEYWSTQVQGGTRTYPQVGGVVFSIPSVTAIYPAALTDVAFVEAIYSNVFGRVSDAEGSAYWANELSKLRTLFVSQGSINAVYEARGQLAINMVNAGLGTPDGTSGKAYIVNRLAASLYPANGQVAKNKSIDHTKLLSIMSTVTADPATVAPAKAAYDALL